MPTPTKPRITAWSFSRWKDYQQCPRKAKLKHVDKLKEPGSAAMDRGGEIDKKAEEFLRGLLPKLPEELKSFAAEFKSLKKQKTLQLQENWALDAKWNFLGKDGWFSKAAWLRVKMDAAYALKNVLNLIDFKPGKPKPDHPDQLELYAVTGFVIFPEAEIANTNLWYTDLGTENPKQFTRDMLPELQAKWMENIAAMMADTRFAPKPGHYCTWCHFRKSNGGPCEY